MRAVVAREPGAPDVLEVVEVPDPVAGEGEVVIDVVAAGINRADLLQRQGHYPVPVGASEVIGMEVSGRVASVGAGVTTHEVGDEVCALLAGGGYAAKVSVPAVLVMSVPGGVDLVAAAALPEVACTVHSNVVMTAGLRSGHHFLVHGGAGGIGTFAIQYAHALGAKVFTTVGSDDKAELVTGLGADVAINYRTESFVEVVTAATGGHGIDVLLDNMGAKYLADNVTALADGGRMVVIGLQGGRTAELDINALMRKRAGVIGTTLRSRPVHDAGSTFGKGTICADVVEHVWPLIASGAIRPVVGATFPLAEADAAHALMESGAHSGKIVLTV